MELLVPTEETTAEALEALQLEAQILEDTLMVVRCSLENSPSDMSDALVNVMYLLYKFQQRQSIRLDRHAAAFLGKDVRA